MPRIFICNAPPYYLLWCDMAVVSSHFYLLPMCPYICKLLIHNLFSLSAFSFIHTGWKAEINAWKLNWYVSTIIGVFLNQKRINLCEHIVKMASRDSFNLNFDPIKHLRGLIRNISVTSSLISCLTALALPLSYAILKLSPPWLIKQTTFNLHGTLRMFSLGLLDIYETSYNTDSNTKKCLFQYFSIIIFA